MIGNRARRRAAVRAEHAWALQHRVRVSAWVAQSVDRIAYATWWVYEHGHWDPACVAELRAATDEFNRRCRYLQAVDDRVAELADSLNR